MKAFVELGIQLKNKDKLYKYSLQIVTPACYIRLETKQSDGSETVDRTAFVKLDIKHKKHIPVIKNTKYDVFVPKNTVKGRLQKLSSINYLIIKKYGKANVATIKTNVKKKKKGGGTPAIHKQTKYSNYY